MWIVEWDYFSKRCCKEFTDETQARGFFNGLSMKNANRNIHLYERSDVNEYKLPEPPNNPVVDSNGRVWVEGVDKWWWCNGQSSSWHTLLVQNGPLKDAPKKPTREEILKIAVDWESGKKANHWVDEVWDLVKDWIKDE